MENTANLVVFDLDHQCPTTWRLNNIMHKVDDCFDNQRQDVVLLDNVDHNINGGLRIHGLFKNNDVYNPLISVITVVLNGEQYLEETIRSVVNQSYNNVEYIIIDGGSTDKTLDIIRQYEDKIDYWVSEKDGGIYDAMNKGVLLSTGEWVNFMNCGDRFYSDDIVNYIFTKNICSDFLYGDVELRYPTFSVIRKSKSLSLIWQGMAFSHQSLFTRRKWHNKHPFEIYKYDVASDYDFICKLVCSEKISAIHEPVVIASVDMVGYSGCRVTKWIVENYKIARSYYCSFDFFAFYIKKYLSALVKEYVKSRLPVIYVDGIRKVLKGD